LAVSPARAGERAAISGVPRSSSAALARRLTQADGKPAFLTSPSLYCRRGAGLS
jgi:hypothetical protein